MASNKKIDKLKAREVQATDSEELLSLAIDIMREVDDVEWATAVFESALSKADKCDIVRRICGELVSYTGRYDIAIRSIDNAISKHAKDPKDLLSIISFFASNADQDGFRERALTIYSDIILTGLDVLTCEDIYQEASQILDELDNRDLALTFLDEAEKKAESHWDFIGIAKEYAFAGDRLNFDRLIKKARENAGDADDLEAVDQEEADTIDYFFSETN
jgi:hypothetical protein